MIRTFISLIVIFFSGYVNSAPYLIQLNGIVSAVGGDNATLKASLGDIVTYTFTFDLERQGEARLGDQIQYFQDDFYAELLGEPNFSGQENSYYAVDTLNYLSEVNGSRSVFTIGNLLNIFIYDYTPSELLTAGSGKLLDISYAWEGWKVEGQTNYVRLEQLEIVSINEIPIPSAFLLFSSAVFGLSLFRKLKRHNKSS